jgi:1-deoxy-D-xylulose-5-phosphate reductoisomerase
VSRKKIHIWGSTGSIGTQTLDVIGQNPERFEVGMLTTHTHAELIWQQARTFHPNCVVITGDVERDPWTDRFFSMGIEVLWGKSGLLEAAGLGQGALVVNALVGSVGLEATLKALDAGSSMALANKEVLVMAGNLVMNRAREKGVTLYPIDSEHSAIFQCLRGEKADVRRILLTASGGPFLHRKPAELDHVTVDEALAHPNWSMGKKVTIDSATMMNKGLEVIEARWLFGVEADQIQVVIHPQSMIHSMVEFEDGSIKAQLGVPDMRIPISYALSYPRRVPNQYDPVDFQKPIQMDFLPPDLAQFPALGLAFETLENGGTAPAALNSADEEAVALFLDGKIRFSQIPEIIRDVLNAHTLVEDPVLEDILQADTWAKKYIRNRYNIN